MVSAAHVQSLVSLFTKGLVMDHVDFMLIALSVIVFVLLNSYVGVV